MHPLPRSTPSPHLSSLNPTARVILLNKADHLPLFYGEPTQGSIPYRAKARVPTAILTVASRGPPDLCPDRSAFMASRSPCSPHSRLQASRLFQEHIRRGPAPGPLQGLLFWPRKFFPQISVGLAPHGLQGHSDSVNEIFSDLLCVCTYTYICVYAYTQSCTSRCKSNSFTRTRSNVP